jgi:hypothetical protein
VTRDQVTAAEELTARVAARAATAAVEAEREEIALALDKLVEQMDTPHDAAVIDMAARNVRARNLVRLP